MRLVEVAIKGTWQRSLTNVLDPHPLTILEVVQVDAWRWTIETTLL